MDKSHWLEISLQVSPEQAEAVAEVLGRYTQEGVVIEQNIEEINLLPEEKLDNSVKVFGYVYAGESIENIKIRLEESLFYLGKIQPLPAPVYKLIHNQDWMSAWKKQYSPLRVGEKLAILPSWAENIFPDRIAIRINPGMAFGTGTHPTTQLCLEMMERKLATGQIIFDIGCGSGILSAAAVKLGAAYVYGVDTNPAAITSSIENANLNEVAGKVDFQQGSVNEILSGCFGIQTAQIVIANILASVILRLFDEGLANMIISGGFLILSGILSNQVPEVIAKAENFGLKLLEKFEKNDWVALGLLKI